MKVCLLLYLIFFLNSIVMWATSDIIFNLLKASVFGRNGMIKCIPYPILYYWQLTWIQVLLGINTNASAFSIYSLYYSYVNPFLNKAKKKYMCVYCHMSKKSRVGWSGLIFFFIIDKIGNSRSRFRNPIPVFNFRKFR